MAPSLGLPPKRGRPRRDEKNKAILLKETTFVIWNKVKTELGFKSKSNNEFAAFLLAKYAEMMIRLVIQALSLMPRGKNLQGKVSVCFNIEIKSRIYIPF